MEALVSRPEYMPAFSPEIAARALIPKELLGQASLLHLTMHIHPSFIETAVSEAAGGEVHWSGCFAFDRTATDTEAELEFIRERNWNSRVFRKCSIGFETSKFCLVPEAFFDPKESKKVLEFSVGEVENEISQIALPEVDAVLIFELPVWASQIHRLFPNARLLPSAYLLLKFGGSQVAADGDMILIYHTPGFMLLCIYKGKKLLLANHFATRNEEDVLYYASNAAMRLNIDFEFAQIRLLDTAKDEVIHNLLTQYNENVSRLFEPENGHDRTFLSNLYVICA